MQEAVYGIGQVSGDLLHPDCVGIGRTAGEVSTPCLELHDKQQVEGNEAAFRPNFNRREINCAQHLPDDKRLLLRALLRLRHHGAFLAGVLNPGEIPGRLGDEAV